MVPSVFIVSWIVRLALANPGAGAVGVFMLPADPPSEARCPALELHAAAALESFPGIKVSRTQELFTAPLDSEAAQALLRAEAAFRLGSRAFDAHQEDAAEQKLALAVAEFGKGAAALKTCSHLCEALALTAASLQRRGDVDGARAELLKLLALDPSATLVGPRYPPALLKLRDSVARSPESARHGNLAIKTQPEGAKLYLDGTLLGISPVESANLPVGRHWLRAERPGYKAAGKIFNVREEPSELSIPLTASQAYQSFLAHAAQLSADLGHGDVRSAAEWGRRLGLSQVLAGVLREREPGASELVWTWIDAPSGQKLGTRRMGFREDAYGQLKLEVERSVTALLNQSAAGEPSKAAGGDPLRGRHGTEVWTAEDRGGKSQAKEKAKPPVDDPLTQRNGTEGW